ncbi:MAG: methionyl-tRNA formyltransferase [Bacillota bacterium]
MMIRELMTRSDGPMRIVFMGTPEFAVPSLGGLLTAGHRVVGVVTQPDRPRGRGNRSSPTPVKEYALNQGLAVWQPATLRRQDCWETLREAKPELIVVVAFGQILPPEVLNLPERGCINVHASLLPRYRGAAPIHRAIINGEKETGVTTMMMDVGLDTGDILLQESISIPPRASSGEMHDCLARLGAEVLVKTINLLERGMLSRQPQDHGAATYAPPLRKSDELIDWQQDADALINRVRGMNPWPGAYTYYKNQVLKIWAAREANGFADGCSKPGQVVQVSEQGITVAVGHGAVLLLEVQPAGKRKMPAGDFVRGYRLTPGTLLGFGGDAREE